ncbi:MAG: alpha-mannosyltransferase [Methylophaga sp.]|nr:MAG: alpha-mannosyltransferase [Methylophaga sp.]
MKIVIATDAWEPQVNGVVRTLNQTFNHLVEMGHEVFIISPEGHRTLPCPSYPSIRLALFPGKKVSADLDKINAQSVHIATEGPIGMAVRRWCIRNKVRFTTSYHTQFPEYLRLRLPIPIRLTYAWLRRFHRRAERTLVPTESMRERLEKNGFNNVHVWGRGVDIQIFTPENPQLIDLPKPILLNMGRVSVEKNIDAFLALDIAGSKVVVGDGPDLEMLKKRYPDVLFTGAKFGQELASWVAAADVFVFPSKTDTFGLVLLEAMACGVPIAAYPVTGPKDVIIDGKTGILNEDLGEAISIAVHLNSQDCIDYARKNSWQACSEVFAHYMHDNSHEKSYRASVITSDLF